MKWKHHRAEWEKRTLNPRYRPYGVGGTAPDGPAQLKRIWLEHSCVVRCDYVLSVDIKGRSNVIQSDIDFELHPFDVRCVCLAVKLSGLFYFLWELFFDFHARRLENEKQQKARNSIGNLRCEQWRCAWQLFHAFSCRWLAVKRRSTKVISGGCWWFGELINYT